MQYVNAIVSVHMMPFVTYSPASALVWRMPTDANVTSVSEDFMAIPTVDRASVTIVLTNATVPGAVCPAAIIPAADTVKGLFSGSHNMK